MPPILDEAGGNANAQLSAGVHKNAEGVPTSRRAPYPWTCANPSCGLKQIGYVEDGCKACGAGADAVQRTPERPTDYGCRVCRGQGTVERKCGTCGGTGMSNAPADGDPPGECPTCGGAGAVAVACGRCKGEGIDPDPQTIPEQPPVIAPATTVAAGKIPAMPQGPSPAAGIFAVLALPTTASALPGLDDPPLTTAPTVVRYRLLRYEGPADEVARVLELSLGGHYQQHDLAITAVEIAPPRPGSGVAAALERARGAGDGTWPARDPFRRMTP